MAQLKYAIIAYDDEKQSKDTYFEAMQAMFMNDDEINFINHWGTVNELVGFINSDGNSAVNQIDRLIVLDNGFQEQDSATQMTEDFTTLEQTMNNSGINHPFLVWLTSNQGVFDLCKKDSKKEEPEILCYERVRVIRLITDSNGNIDNDSLINGIDGTSDKSALSIRKDFISRGERAINILKERQDATNNVASQTKNLNNISDKLKQLYNVDDTTTKDKNKDKDGFRSAYDTMKNKQDELAHQFQKHTVTAEKINVKNNQSSVDTDDAKSNLISQIEANVANLQPNTRFNLRVKYQAKHHAFAIVVSGKHGVGVSSIVANLAECYACLKQKVLIINGSNNDSLAHFYPQFVNKYQESGRHNVLKDRSNKNGNQTRYIPVTSYIDLMSDIGETQANYTLEERIGGIPTFLLNDNGEHQIVLIDAGENAYQAMKIIGFLNVSAMIFVADNECNALDDLKYLGNTKQGLVGLLQTTFQDKPLGLIVNKCTNQDFLSNRQKMNETNIIKYLPTLAPPFDRLMLLGKIPYYSAWHLQSNLQQRACYFNDEIFDIIMTIAERAVVS